jgi:Uma2 family endonuclease
MEDAMHRNRLIVIGLSSVLFLVSASQSHAILQSCDECSCSLGCSTRCPDSSGNLITCGDVGVCFGSSACGGTGCLTASDPGLKDLFRQQPVRTTPAEHERGRVAARLTWRLAQHVDELGLGEVYAAETGFLLPADGGVRTPDLAFVSREHLEPSATRNSVRTGAPDLAVEIPSGPVTSPAVRAKVRDWLAAGTRAVLVVDANAKALTIYRGRVSKIYRAGDLLDLSDVVPGWTLRTGDLFE